MLGGGVDAATLVAALGAGPPHSHEHDSFLLVLTSRNPVSSDQHAVDDPMYCFCMSLLGLLCIPGLIVQGFEP